MTTTTEAPKTRRDVEQEFREMAERRFKEHQIAEYSIVDTPGGTKIELLRWRKPGTGIYAITYLVIGNTLYVSGDCYEATYVWSSAVSLEWISGMHQQYFASKCMAAPQGRDFKIWDRHEAEQAVRDHFADRQNDLDYDWNECVECGGTGGRDNANCPPCEGGGEIKVFEPDPERAQFDELGGWRALQADEHEWIEWLRDHGYDVFGSDHWEWTAGVGKVYDPSCIAHLVGLKMAIAQLKPAAAEQSA